MKKIIIITAICLLISLNIKSQDIETISIALTDPSAPGYLKIYNHNGTIDVIGYDGSTVEVEIESKDEGKNNRHNRRGLRRIPNKAMSVSIVEEDNQVHIKASNNNLKNYTIKIPKKFSLNVTAHSNGDIRISNVIGELEIISHHGGIVMNDVGGSVIADTHHGAIRVNLTEVKNGVPMAFTTYHGDVDITFPPNLNAQVKMKSGRGDIYTDFDFEAKKGKIERTHRGNKKEVKVSGWTYGTIGSGGAEMMFDTYHGDVIIRKSK